MSHIQCLALLPLSRVSSKARAPPLNNVRPKRQLLLRDWIRYTHVEHVTLRPRVVANRLISEDIQSSCVESRAVLILVINNGIQFLLRPAFASVERRMLR